MTIEEIAAAQIELEAALRGDMHIPAIRAIRALTGAGLREAKAVADAMFAHITRVTTTCEYRAVPVDHDNDHHIVAVDDGHYTEVIHFRDSHSRADALTCAKGKLDCYDNSQFNITVAKVIATTKRTLVTL